MNQQLINNQQWNIDINEVNPGSSFIEMGFIKKKVKKPTRLFSKKGRDGLLNFELHGQK